MAVETYLDERRTGFRPNDELVPVSGRRDEFQELVERFVEQQRHRGPSARGQLRVKDVAIRRGAGTASLGLARYYLLIEGPRADGTDDLIIEFKRARRSALDGLVPAAASSGRRPGRRASRTRSAVQLVRGDVFYGSVEFDGLSFMTRERAPFRDDIDLDDLSKSEWKEYADILRARSWPRRMRCPTRTASSTTTSSR